MFCPNQYLKWLNRHLRENQMTTISHLKKLSPKFGCAHTGAHTLRLALTIRAPGFHRHAEVSCLDLATIHWNGRVLTHETRHYVGAAWAERWQKNRHRGRDLLGRWPERETSFKITPWTLKGQFHQIWKFSHYLATPVVMEAQVIFLCLRNVFRGSTAKPAVWQVAGDPEALAHPPHGEGFGLE